MSASDGARSELPGPLVEKPFSAERFLEAMSDQLAS
jgi:hypothetical protein